MILAAVAVFYIWDNVANKGLYTAQIERSVGLVAGFKLIN
ncbi:hypothetical protein X747_29575 [Mesorhizobium sp. LNJC384A00]|nr:hypothetical protein X752_14585 [Mesorhizobium sp. LNJC398B00]ESY26876.1 hypothetical protein X749_24880 [Mesorhizobium sp. LNJC391B00]ESY34634.1 hypothetical protein X747_29575 [Mesorhizobium sp. LNJC384A00]